jgi:hypothetical protein
MVSAQRVPTLSKRECFDPPLVALGLRNCRPGPGVPSFAFPETWILDQRRPACGCPLWACPRGGWARAALGVTAFADSAIEVNMVAGKQEAKFSIGDAKCVLVDEQIKCMPMVVASN